MSEDAGPPRPYPIVNPNPSIVESLRNLNGRDVSVIAMCTVMHLLACNYGYRRWPAAHYFKLGPSMKFHGVLLGVVVATTFGSDMRLMGVSENSYEVRKYGVYQLDESGVYPGRDPLGANWNAITSFVKGILEK